MYVWGLTVEQLQSALNDASQSYQGNLIWNQEPAKRGRALMCTVRVKDSHGPGAKISLHALSCGGKERHTVAACWHAYRDVMRAIFMRNADARVKTGMADYRGAEDFRGKYQETGRRNVGSQMNPVDYAQSCDCGEL